MRKRDFAILVGILAFGLIFLYMITGNAKKEYLIQKESLINFEAEAKELDFLTKRYDDKKRVTKEINSLKKSYHVSRESKKSDSLVLEFENLNKPSLNSLVKKLENSSLEIKSLDISKNETKANLKVELYL